MLNQKGQVLYIGKSKNLKSRVRSYFYEYDRSHKIETMIHYIDYIQWIETETHLDACLLEFQLIKDVQPIYNTQFKQNRPLRRVGIKDHQVAYVGPKDPNYFTAVKSRQLNYFIKTLASYYPLILKDGKFHFEKSILDPRLTEKDWEENEKSLRLILGHGISLLQFEKMLQDKMKEASKNLHFERANEYKELTRSLHFIYYWTYELPAFLTATFQVTLPTLQGEKTYLIDQGQIIKTIYQGVERACKPIYPKGLTPESVDFLQIPHRETRPFQKN